jgi:hypothetical protein
MRHGAGKGEGAIGVGAIKSDQERWRKREEETTVWEEEG